MSFLEPLAFTPGSFHAPWGKSLHSTSFECSYSGQKFLSEHRNGSTFRFWNTLLKISILLHKWVNKPFWLDVSLYWKRNIQTFDSMTSKESYQHDTIGLMIQAMHAKKCLNKIDSRLKTIQNYKQKILKCTDRTKCFHSNL